MTDFYNRYRNLFSLKDRQEYKGFNDNKHIFTQPAEFSSHNYLSLPPYDRKPSNYLNVARSPALEEFQRQVLPKFGRPYPEQHFMRLKTEMVQNTLKMNQKISRNSNAGHQLYQLPRVHTKTSEKPIKQRVMTEGGDQYVKSRHYEPYVRRDMFKNIQQLQKQYLGRAYPNEEDRILDKKQLEPIRLQNSRQRVMTYNEPAQGYSRMQKVKYGNGIKKWELKVLPIIQSKSKRDNTVITPREANPNNNTQFKLYQSRQKQLYGLRQNQYAFVNDKLSDIKKAEKYYPRGYINSYRQALFRRKSAKNQLQQRRFKLKMLLHQQDSRM